MNICDSMWVSLPENIKCTLPRCWICERRRASHIAKMLYMRTEKGLDIFLRILAYLLELVESHDARTVSLLKTLEYLRQRIFRTGYVSKP